MRPLTFLIATGIIVFLVAYCALAWGDPDTALIKLTGPDGQTIYINPNAIVSMRKPRGAEHVAPNINCLLHTDDGKFIAILETCEALIHQVEQPNK